MLLFYVLVFWPRGMWDLSSPTRDQTCTPFIGKWNLNHWTIKEVPISSYFFYLFIFNWIIALQHCVGFCHTSVWISHRNTLFPPSWTSVPPPSPPHPSRLSQSTELSSLFHTANSHRLSVLHMAVYMFQCCSFSSSHPFLPPLCPQVCSVCLCLHCCPVNRLISTIFLESIYMG